MSSNDEALREPDPSQETATDRARLRIATDADAPRGELPERDDSYYDEVREAVGGGTRSLLLGTSRRSIRHAIDQIETAQSSE
jgi:hypothetical protein